VYNRRWSFDVNFNLTTIHIFELLLLVITHADGSRGNRFLFFTSVCLSVIFAQYLKTDAARIIRLDIEMFHDELWKSIYFGYKRSKIKVTSHKYCRCGSLHSCECWLLLVHNISYFGMENTDLN